MCSLRTWAEARQGSEYFRWRVGDSEQKMTSSAVCHGAHPCRGAWVWSEGPGKWEPEVELGHTQVGIGISGERPSAALSLCLTPEPSPVFLTIPILLSLHKGGSREKVILCLF